MTHFAISSYLKLQEIDSYKNKCNFKLLIDRQKLLQLKFQMPRFI